MLNVIFLALAVLSIVRFMQTGGPTMLRMMEEGPMQERM
jgi:hypothetical protein